MYRIGSVILLFLNLPFLQVHAQQLIDKMAKHACACIEKEKMETSSEEEMTMKLGLCILDGLSILSDEERESLKLDFQNQAAMEKLGEEIGLRMVTHCPTTMMNIGLAMSGEVTVEKAENTVLSAEGIFQSLEITGDFAHLLLKQENGQIQKFLWLGYFEGAERLTAPESLKGKKVRLSYASQSIYSPKLQEYIDRKVVRGLMVLN